MALPSFSLVIETANLSLADLDGLRETLETLEAQTVSPRDANEVFLADSGDVPDAVLQEALKAFPWVRHMRLPDGTGYEELKMAGALASTGDVVVFADGDCHYDPRWLETLLAPLADPAVTIVGGETRIEPAGPYELGVAMAASFPAYSPAAAPYLSDRYHLNNVAFRRSVLDRVPIPSRRPCYRMSGLHAARLERAGHRILRQPAARAQHAAPNGFTHFFWRFLLMGYDGVVVPRLIAAERASTGRRGERRRRTLRLVRFWFRQAVAKFTGALRERPARAFMLPLALPVFAAAVALQAAGALAGLVAPQQLLAMIPDDVLRGSTTARQDVPAPEGASVVS